MGAAWDELPSYLRLGTDELAARARQALALLGEERCGVCPRLCKVDRLADHKGLCAIGRQAVVASYFPHFGEENCLRRSGEAAPVSAVGRPEPLVADRSIASCWLAHKVVGCGGYPV